MLALFASMTACAPEPADRPIPSLRHEVDTVGSVIRVRSTGTPPAWALNPVITIGSAAELGEPAPDECGRITSVTTDKRGAIWVADALSHDIKVFGADGSFVSRIGRETTKVPIADAEWEAARSEYVAFLDKWPGAKCEPSSTLIHSASSASAWHV